MKLRMVYLFLLCLSVASAYASNMGFLNNTAITYFQGDDKNLMVMNISHALDQVKDGVKSGWNNPKTGLCDAFSKPP